MVKKIYFVVILLVCTSCIRTYLLSDGVTKVPYKEKLFINPKFGIEVFKIIDTNSIYIEEYTFYRGTREISKGFTTILRFYPNGLYNEFTINKNHLIMNDFEQINLNFKETGIRGYYYLKGDKIQLVSFGPKDEMYTIGKVQSNLIVVDNDFIKESYPNEKVSYYYKKVNIAEKWKQIKPNDNWK